MNRWIVASALLLSTMAMANERGRMSGGLHEIERHSHWQRPNPYRHPYSYPHHHGQGWSWGPPVALAGVTIYRSVQLSPPVLIPQQQIFSSAPNCTPWTVTQNGDGTLTHTRYCD